MEDETREGRAGQEPESGRDMLREFQARVEAAIEDVRPKIRRALEELDARVDEAVADIRPRAQNAMQDVRPKVDQFVADVQPRLDSVLERLQQRIEELRRDLDMRATRAGPRDTAASSAGQLPPIRARSEPRAAAAAPTRGRCPATGHR